MNFKELSIDLCCGISSLALYELCSQHNTLVAHIRLPRALSKLERNLENIFNGVCFLWPVTPLIDVIV